MTVAPLTLALALAAAGEPAEGDARAELEACALRIEELKAQREEGARVERQLERLLVRAQELAAQLDLAARDLPPPPPVAPSPDELRERADAARDEADRLAGEIGLLDVRIQDARRTVRGELRGPVEDAALGSAAPGSRPGAAAGLAQLHHLELARAALAERRARAEAEVARLDAEARAAETDR